ncbi:hypothetical protein FAES_4010 [Fibrella aestuarina BUZ 2]|uniref:DOD-type homing endonuclease domain-containing protein n=1 Tax=Fibrella aestuarina BUZ 2 TaxID=1166018 RepID=I0KD07_9BACT|nr:hypothetical protein [Fibrella aestuarina]CCH02010.1 hypothetical protein FAES_4010 [Fibrella aestuarina BUZ 2]
MRKSNPVDIKQLVNDYLAGAQLVLLARQNRTTSKRIRHLLVEQGIIIRTSSESNLMRTRVDTNKIVADYKAGKGYVVIAKEYQISQQRVKQTLIDLGVTLRSQSEKSRRYSITEADIAQAVAEYEEGVTLTSLSKKYKVYIESLKRLLIERGVVLRTISQAQSIRTAGRPSQKRYTLDESFLDVIDTEVKAYWLGFMYADGYNGEYANKVVLSLQARDRPILERFARELDTDRPLYFRKVSRGQSQFSLSFSNKHLSKRLAELGCHQAKTFTTTFPDWMPDVLLPHFIRGYIDGDGCIQSKFGADRNSRICVIQALGSTAFITRFADVIRVNCEVGGSFVDHPKSPGIIRYDVSGRLQVCRVLAWLYKDATIYLNRKKRSAEKILVPYMLPERPLGEARKHSKLTNDQVLLIKSQIESREPYKVIAEAFGVKETAIKDIAIGATWRHITGYSQKANAARGSAKGEHAGSAKLTEADVREIKTLIEAGQLNTEIAARFGVTNANISYIRKGKGWTHVTGWNEQTNAGIGVARGSQYKRAVLTETQVADIKAMMRQGLGDTKIASQLGLKRTTLLGIRQGRNWKHIK